MAGKDVSLRDFLNKIFEAHKTGKNQLWVAKELGISSSAVCSRITRLRHKGVRVPYVYDRCRGRNANVEKEATKILRNLGID